MSVVMLGVPEASSLSRPWQPPRSCRREAEEEGVRPVRSGHDGKRRHGGRQAGTWTGLGGNPYRPYGSSSRAGSELQMICPETQKSERAEAAWAPAWVGQVIGRRFLRLWRSSIPRPLRRKSMVESAVVRIRTADHPINSR